MLHDFRFALRLFRSHRGTSLLAVLTLALGIGATTTVFGIFDVLFVRPLAAPAPERLVRLQLVAKDGRTQTALSYPLFADLREHVNAFSHIAGYVEGAAAVQLGDYSDRLTVECVTSDYFTLLGARPEIGRSFSAGEEARREPVAILSHGLWQRIFDGNPLAVGATVTVNGQPFTVIGIAGEAFTGVRQAAAPGLWVPAPWFLSFAGIPDLLQQRASSA